VIDVTQYRELPHHQVLIGPRYLNVNIFHWGGPQIHIPRSDVPKVIARFGSMVNLVTQVLEPTIGNYFRNAAQNSDVIDFLKNRQTRQEEARKSISDALREYNVG